MAPRLWTGVVVQGGYFDDAVPALEEDEDDAEEFDFEAPDIPLGSGRGASERMERYFADLERRMRVEYELAGRCRTKGFDPQTHVEIPPAIDLAARVEELMKDYLPQRGVAERIRELSKIKNREETSLLVANEVAAGKFGRFDDKVKALDGAIRTGLAILTEGILVAPLEGIAGVRILQNDDGTDCVAISFAGPIRAAGGTGQALSVLLADVVRRELGIGKYLATEKEISRMKEEIPAYKAAANLQYVPSNEEIELIMKNCPVMIDGEGTEKDEIGGNRDLPRIETNQIRGGACLVLAEGMTQKAPKIQKNVKALKLDGWDFIDKIIEYVKKKGAAASAGGGGKKFTDPWAKEAENERGAIEPSPKYLADLIAGRPVFAYPSRKGGWRLRYGRARTGGLATTAIHPAAMALVDDFLAPGTQMKVERPGKATACTPCDSIEGPIALLANGNLIEVTTYRQGKAIRPMLRSVIDLGENLVPYGEFAENNKTLPQSPWCDEWWQMAAEKATGGAVPALADSREAFDFAQRTATPLHPRWNLFWHDVTVDDIKKLSSFVEANGRWGPVGATGVQPDISAFPEAYTLHLPKALAEQQGIKDVLVELGALHECDKDVIRLGRHAYALVRCLGLEVAGDALVRRMALDAIAEQGSCRYVSAMSGVKIMPRAMFRIGTRMGRPEKAAERKMNPPVHLLFPIGIMGGSQRLMVDAVKANKIEVEIGERQCPKCGQKMVSYRCEACSEHTLAVPPKGRLEPRLIELAPMWDAALERLRMDAPETVKGVTGLVSSGKFPEPLEKGILRAKHGLFTFKDATVRYDMINVTLTHFKPREAHVSVEKLLELGYTHDVKGEPLTRDDQVLELNVQDIIVATGCLDYMLKASQYIDELLQKMYGFKPYYNCKTKEDLYGHLFVALAPHTSGGVLCRIIGHTKAQAHYGHPYFHAAKRRNCFRGDTEILLQTPAGLRKTRLDELVEANLRDAQLADAHGTLVGDAPPGLEAVSLDADTLVPRALRISKLVKGTTGQWIHIESSTHRTLVVTPDHRVLVRREGSLLDVAAAEVRPNDQIPLGMSLPRETRAPVFELGQVLAPLPEAKDIRIRGAEDFLRALIEPAGRDAMAQLCGATDVQARMPSRWYGSFPIQHYAALVAAGRARWEDVPEDARLAIARDNTSVPVRLRADSDLARIVGFYLAEGHARSTASAHQLSWRVPHPALSADLQARLRRVFGREPTVEEDGSKVTLASRIVYLLLERVWRVGAGAHTKRVPSWCYTLPDNLVADVVSGFFDGDGSVLVEPQRLRLYSASRLLLEDIALLLQSASILARFVPGHPRAPGSFLRARYESLGRDVPESLRPVHALSLYGADIKAFAGWARPAHPEKAARLADLVEAAKPTRVIQVEGRQYDPEETAHCLFDRVLAVRAETVDEEPTYCIDVDSGSTDVRTRNVLLGNGLYQIRCDGDEDCVMLLLDGLLNFSRSYLPSNRGGLMDAPLTLTMRLDPSEVDKEAHNVDVMFRYPLEFYEATMKHPGPKDVEKLVDMVAKRLGKPSQYEGFGFTHDTADIAEGPPLSAYKTIGSMMDKMTAQLELAARIRAVDAPDVASRVIGSHFLPDMMGNLKAFSKQAMRCTKCNAKFRRVPLTGKCRKCGNPNLTMTVHEGSVKKYLEVSREVSVRFKLDDYTKQRIEHVSDSIDSIFTNDRVKKAKLSDFF